LCRCFKLYQSSAPLQTPSNPLTPLNPPPKVNVRDALLRTITYDAPNGKQYRLKPASELATLLVR